MSVFYFWHPIPKPFCKNILLWVFKFSFRTSHWNRIVWHQLMDGKLTTLLQEWLWMSIPNSLTISEEGHFQKWVVYGWMQIMWSVFMPLENSFRGKMPHLCTTVQQLHFYDCFLLLSSSKWLGFFFSVFFIHYQTLFCFHSETPVLPCVLTVFFIWWEWNAIFWNLDLGKTVNQIYMTVIRWLSGRGYWHDRKIPFNYFWILVEIERVRVCVLILKHY